MKKTKTNQLHGRSLSLMSVTSSLIDSLFSHITDSDQSKKGSLLMTGIICLTELQEMTAVGSAQAVLGHTGVWPNPSISDNNQYTLVHKVGKWEPIKSGNCVILYWLWRLANWANKHKWRCNLARVGCTSLRFKWSETRRAIARLSVFNCLRGTNTWNWNRYVGSH